MKGVSSRDIVGVVHAKLFVGVFQTSIFQNVYGNLSKKMWGGVLHPVGVVIASRALNAVVGGGVQPVQTRHLPRDLNLCRGSMVQGSGFRVQGSGFRVQGSGFRVQGSGFRVQGSEFKMPPSPGLGG